MKTKLYILIWMIFSYPSICLSNMAIETPLFVSGFTESVNSTFSHTGIIGEPTVSRNMTASTYMAHCGWSFVVKKTPVIPLQTSHETITDVTPGSFSVLWTANQKAQGTLQIFEDENGDNEITDIVSIIYENLHFPEAESNGIIKVRVENLSPYSLYFFKIMTYASESNETLISDMYHVTTEISSDLVSNNAYIQPVYRTGGSLDAGSEYYADGTLLLISVDDSDYPVSGWVGDKNWDSPYAEVNLNNLYSKNTHMSLDIAHGELLTIEAYGGLQGFSTFFWDNDESNPGYQYPEKNGEILPVVLLQGKEMTLKQDLNLFTYPTKIPENFTAYDLLQLIGNKDEIIKIKTYDNAYTNKFQEVYWALGSPRGDNFDISPTTGMLIHMKQSKAIFFEGSMNSSKAVDLYVGLNFVGFSNPSPCLTSHDIMRQLGKNKIRSIRSFEGEWLKTNWVIDQLNGPDFPITHGKSYVIDMDNGYDSFIPGQGICE